MGAQPGTPTAAATAAACRCPWSAARPPFGFGPEPARRPGCRSRRGSPTTPGRYRWATADSMLELYRAALHLRRSEAALGDGEMTWFHTPPGSLGFTRDPGFACIVNVSADPVPVPVPDGLDGARRERTARRRRRARGRRRVVPALRSRLGRRRAAVGPSSGRAVDPRRYPAVARNCSSFVPQPFDRRLVGD